MIDFYLEGTDALNALAGRLPMTFGSYVGLAIGPQSDYGQLIVHAGGHSPFVLTAGNVMPIGRGGEPWSGQPKLAWRGVGFAGTGFLGSPNGTTKSSELRLHVLGFEHYCELAAACSHRAPGRPWMFVAKEAAETVTWQCAFQGRKHGMFAIDNSAAVDLVVRGFITLDDEIRLDPLVPQGKTELAAESLAAVGSDNLNVLHIGGEDHAEPWDILEFEFSGANAADIFLQGNIGGEWR